MSARRITLLGGSFNPIHLGHIALARQVLTEGLADEVWLLVSPQNPLKRQAALLDERLRYDLACRALAGESGIRASDFEFSLPRPSYTWATLQALGQAYPQTCFTLLIGGDNWLIFDRWAHADDIRRHYPLIIYPREGYPVDAATLPPGVTLLSSAPRFPFSSTDIREAAASGRSLDGMVPPCIIDEVKRLYGPATAEAER